MFLLAFSFSPLLIKTQASFSRIEPSDLDASAVHVLRDGVGGHLAIGQMDADAQMEVIAVDWNTCEINCIDGLTGAIQWLRGLDVPASAFPVVVDVRGNSRPEVLIPSRGSGLHCINGTSATDLWVTPLNMSYAPGMTAEDIDGDGNTEVVIGTCDQKLWSLDGQNGSIKWNVTLPAYATFQPVTGDFDRDGTCEILISGIYNVFCCDGEDGSIEWSYTSPEMMFSVLSAFDVNGDGTAEIFTTSSDGNVICLNGENGTERWKAITPGIVFTGCSLNTRAAVPTLVFSCLTGSEDSALICAMNALDGSIIRSSSSPIMMEATPPCLVDIDNDGVVELITSGVNYPSSEGGRIACFSAETLRLEWSWNNSEWILSAAIPCNLRGDGHAAVVMSVPGHGIVYVQGTGWWWSMPTAWPCFGGGPGLAASTIDTDGDGVQDAIEVAFGLNTTSTDSDGDGLDDFEEMNHYSSNPIDNDTDNDDVPDDVEVAFQSNPNLADTDGDLVSDYDEIFVLHTDPTVADTDGDGLDDRLESFVYHTNATTSDTDTDGLSDGQEVLGTRGYKTNATNPDTDGDSLLDGPEVLVYHSNPLSVDGDGDGLSDPDEVLVYFTNPMSVDTDGDGWTDPIELSIWSDPRSAFTPTWLIVLVGAGAFIAVVIIVRVRKGIRNARLAESREKARLRERQDVLEAHVDRVIDKTISRFHKKFTMGTVKKEWGKKGNFSYQEIAMALDRRVEKGVLKKGKATEEPEDQTYIILKTTPAPAHVVEDPAVRAPITTPRKTMPPPAQNKSGSTGKQQDNAAQEKKVLSGESKGSTPKDKSGYSQKATDTGTQVNRTVLKEYIERQRKEGVRELHYLKIKNDLDIISQKKSSKLYRILQDLVDDGILVRKGSNYIIVV